MEQEKQRALKTLHYKRGALKTRLTICKNFINKLTLDRTQPEYVQETSTLYEVEHRLAKIDNLLEEFEQIQSEIEAIDDKTTIEIHYSERETFETLYFKVVGTCKQIVAELTLNNARQEVISSSSTDSQSVGKNRSRVKLPTIVLPKFDGTFEMWLEFRDTYNSLIHNNTDLDPIEKYHYLKASLIDSAAQVIKSLPISDANYDIAWKLICDRYDNRRSLIFNHIKALFNIPDITHAASGKLRDMIDNASKNIRTLANLNLPIEQWGDVFIIHLLGEKLDSETASKWEEHKIASEIPNFEDFKKFIEDRAELLESIESKSKITSKSPQKSKQNSKSFVITSEKCALCNGPHKLFSCADFLVLSPNLRYERAKQLKLCVNCLKSGHYSKNCKSSKCKECAAKHNTLLHFETPQRVKGETKVLTNQNNTSSEILLPTVMLKIFDKHGKPHDCRSLLDSGSQSNFISTALCRKLNLETTGVKISIVGINHIKSNITDKCDVRIKSRLNNFTDTITCFVIPEISKCMPSHNIDVTSFSVPEHIKLADPNFDKPAKIDMLLGAEVFWKLICIGQKTMGSDNPTLQKTRFGWIVSGKIGAEQHISKGIHCNFSQDLDDQLRRFWEIEESSNEKVLTKEEHLCESHFITTQRRNDEGRFIVSIPLKQTIDTLGDSKQNALNRFQSLERKLKHNHVLKQRYVAFMDEYISLGHMTKVDPKIYDQLYYLPHHGVLKEDRTTTKLRVVFDGSAQTTSGISVNDIQMVGPTIQNDLFSIILRFRQHQIVISADIAKMYRQVLVDPKQRILQCIFWRSNPIEPLDTFLLNTITYGTAAAAYLAIRCLKQLADEHAIEHPQAAQVIKDDFYVDDLLTGFDSIEEATSICQQVDHILSKGCFQLRKWISNEPEVLKGINCENQTREDYDFGSHENSKTLGIFWAPKDDLLFYNIKIDNIYPVVTKRTILSAIAQIFDPLGLLGACTIKAKIILQRLWSEKIEWDESLPSDIHSEWINYSEELHNINNIKIPRRVICRNAKKVDIHGFCDASQQAYGACIYVRSEKEDGTISVHLLTAKSKVAPIKTLSIPRLELCGVLVLSRLQAKVAKSLTKHINNFYLWTDSQIVLAWIKTPVNQLKTFVANRIDEIQNLTKNAKWQYVCSKDNPADLISRGISPKLLINSKLWFHGPNWLQQNQSNWPNILGTAIIVLPELKSKLQCFNVNYETNSFINKFSSFNKLTRTISYCLRFIKNSKKHKTERQNGPLTTEELRSSLTCLVKIVQRECFQEELHCLKQGKALNHKSKILNLNPFLDSMEVIRVGGRLRHSKLPYTRIHPILLPNEHHFVSLLFVHEHIRLAHASQQQLLYSIRDQFWPISGRNMAKKTVHNCIKCYRMKPKPINPIMGDLPSNRILPALPFVITGVDYAGPFMIKDKKGRGSKVTKCYVSLFVCYTTKAIHIELVSDLTTEAFIAALRRFTSRRGKPIELHSDNGTNFVGARNELKELNKFLQESANAIIEATTHEGMKWSFIPPRTPHFGGLWEAGVKSAKYHLKRIMGNARLTFEEFNTLLNQVEAVLNSRPLSPMSSDPNDLTPISPSHFLIGRLLTSVPDPDLLHIPENRLSAYQRLQQLRQHFWHRWSHEYISELQVRRKNQKGDSSTISVGTLVLIKEDNSPPLCWPLGRITHIHPGADGQTRVVSIRTSKGIIQRAVTRVCQLPLQQGLSTSQCSESATIGVSQCASA